MNPDHPIAKLLRFLGIVFLSITSGLGLLAGIGTACVALDPAGFGPNMAKLMPFQAAYLFFMLAGIALGLAGIGAVIQLIKAQKFGYRNSLIVLLLSVLIGFFHISLSRMLRGTSMPYDMILWITEVTLGLFLFFRVPGIWQGVDFSQGNEKHNRSAGGTAAIILGILTLTIQAIMAPSHTWAGTNYAAAFIITTSLTGLFSILFGIGYLTWEWVQKFFITSSPKEKQPIL